VLEIISVYESQKVQKSSELLYNYDTCSKQCTWRIPSHVLKVLNASQNGTNFNIASL